MMCQPPKILTWCGKHRQTKRKKKKHWCANEKERGEMRHVSATS